MHYIATVIVKFKKSVLEPQGQAITLALENSHAIENIRVGKHIEVSIEANSIEAAKKRIEEISENMLYNPVMEVCEIEVNEQK